MSRRNGFTIVELLMVIAVLAVLSGIITTAAVAAIRQARSRRADALREVLQAGIATYHAQTGKWPGERLQDWAENGMSDSERKDPVLKKSDNFDLMSFLVRECARAGGSAVMDVSGLSITPKNTANNTTGRVYGQELRSAIAQQAKRGGKIDSRANAFGYVNADGYFRLFKIVYNPNSDSVSVPSWKDNEEYKKWLVK